MDGWAAAQDADASALDRLASLAKGELLTWTDRGVEAVRFFPKRTFDASKTPEAGDVRPTGVLPRIDLDAVRTAMAATIEESKANDPKALRARVAELERQLAAGSVASVRAETTEVVREVSVVPPAVLALGPAVAPAVLALRGVVVEIERALGELDEAHGAAVREVGEVQRGVVAARQAVPTRPVAPRRPEPPRTQPRASGAATGRAGDGSGMEVRVRRVLTVLAQFGGTVSRRKMGAVAGYAPYGSSMQKALATARAEGWARDAGTHDGAEITPEGRRALGKFDPLPTGAALREYWRANLPDQRSTSVFTVLMSSGGRLVSRENLAEATGYEAYGSSMQKALATLRAHEIVVDGPDGAVSVVPELFGG